MAWDVLMLKMYSLLICKSNLTEIPECYLTNGQQHLQVSVFSAEK